MLWEFLHVDERLVDIGDDLVDYEVRACCSGCPPACTGTENCAVQEDVLANSFNILRGAQTCSGPAAQRVADWSCAHAAFVCLYGRDAQMQLVRCAACSRLCHQPVLTSRCTG